MDSKATLLAIGGVVAMGLGMIILAIVSGQPVDTKTIELVVTGLLGFSGGVGTTVLATALKSATDQKTE